MRRGGVAEEKAFEQSIETILVNAGLHLLEFSVSRHRNNVTVKAVIYSPAGTGTDECTRAYRLILPQVQLAYDTQSPSIEVSSPGIDRILKSARDWKAFVGKQVKVLRVDHDEWFAGVLREFADGRAVIEGREGPVTIELSSIVKARLDASYKGE